MIHLPRVKLPKLSLKRFNGDLTKWTTFWDTFKSAVHDNPTLTNIDKFNYLNSLLESAAAEAIAGLTLTSAYYEEAIATLRRRFGNKQLIVNRHMDLLLNLEGVTSQHNLKGLSLGRKGLGRSPPTALSLMAGASARVTCVYCDHPHSSNSCQTSLIQRKGSDFFAPVGVASCVSDDTTLAETADHLPDVPGAVEDIIPASVQIQAQGW